MPRFLVLKQIINYRVTHSVLPFGGKSPPPFVLLILALTVLHIILTAPLYIPHILTYANLQHRDASSVNTIYFNVPNEEAKLPD
jgi:hypothetical protein